MHFMSYANVGAVALEDVICPQTKKDKVCDISQQHVTLCVLFCSVVDAIINNVNTSKLLMLFISFDFFLGIACMVIW